MANMWTEGSSYDFYLVEVYAALGRVHTTAGDHRLALSYVVKALAKTHTQSLQAASVELHIEPGDGGGDSKHRCDDRGR